MGVLPLKRIGATGAVLAFASLALTGAISACGTSSNASARDGGGESGGPDSSSDDSSSVVDAWAMWTHPPPSCKAGQPTSITGRVYDPANVNPLYNVTVYLTSSTPGPITRGAHCGSCSSVLTKPVLGSAVTDANGDFRMVGEQMISGITTPPLPTGDNLTLVVQAGKWRKVYAINVAACRDNPQADHTLRLPKSRMEGSLPDIAISTGAGDSLECLLRRIGVDDSEYVAGAGTPDGGHVHIFSSTNGAGGATIQGGSPEPGSTLWDKVGDMMPYDVVLLSCEDAETAHLDDAGRKVLADYAANGGGVFASHFHYSFFTPTGPFAIQTPPLATWTTGAQPDQDPISGQIVTIRTNGMPFPDGIAFSAWLGNVGALQNGELPIRRASDNAEVTATNSTSQPWITADQGSSSPGHVQYFSFDPSNADSVCGRVVYSDLHASGSPKGSTDPGADYSGSTPGVVPDGCSLRRLTPQEQALEYMLFDLSRCVVYNPPWLVSPNPGQ